MYGAPDSARRAVIGSGPAIWQDGYCSAHLTHFGIRLRGADRQVSPRPGKCLVELSRKLRHIHNCGVEQGDGVGIVSSRGVRR